MLNDPVVHNLLALAAATLLLVAIPGPNVALTVATSLSHGFRAAAITVAGTVAGLGMQLALVVSGLAALLQVAASALTWIKWLGVAYLLVLGVQTWRRPADDLAGLRPRPVYFGHGMFIAVTNPKTLLFHAAFLPQFVPSGAGFAELALAAVVMLTVVLVGDLCWALLASRARAWLTRFGGLRNRLTGAFLVLAGVGLAMSRR